MRIGNRMLAAMKARDAADTLSDELWEVLDKEHTIENMTKWKAALAVYQKAGDLLDDLEDKCEQLIIKHRKAILKLHEQECKNCPWDGWTIFDS